MATDQLTATVTCPACQQPIAMPTAARHTGHGQATVTLDTSAVHAHIATHVKDQPAPDPYQRREAMAAWLTANGVDPNDVPLHADITVDDQNGQRVIRYEAFQRDGNGDIFVADGGTGAAVEERTTLLTTEPPAELAPHVDPPRTR